MAESIKSGEFKNFDNPSFFKYFFVINDVMDVVVQFIPIIAKKKPGEKKKSKTIVDKL